MLGGRVPPHDPVEPNLCVGEARTALCDVDYAVFSRVEVLVADASGSGQEVWSPVCYPEDATLRQQLAKLACEQFYYYPWARTSPWYMRSEPGPVAFPMPQGEGWRWGRRECFQACLTSCTHCVYNGE